MHVFIDESGSFASRSDGSPSVCCVATLAVTEADLPAVLTGYERIVAGWHLDGAEPKGSKLSERQVDRVLTHLGNFDVVLTIAAIDMGQHRPADIEAHRRDQAEKIRTSADGPEYKETLRQDFRDLGARVEALPNPLYVQTHLLSRAIQETMQTTKVRYAQTRPDALGAFSFRIDAKDRVRTEYERVWGDVVKPMLQTYSLKGGLITITGPGFDYSAMERFENPVMDEMPAHLAKGREELMPKELEKELAKNPRNAQFHSFDVGKLIEDVEYGDSLTSPGLQLVDIAGNAFRRAMNGRLQERGWRRLGRLLVSDFRGRSAVRYVTIKVEGGGGLVNRMPYGQIAIRLENDARDWKVAS